MAHDPKSIRYALQRSLTRYCTQYSALPPLEKQGERGRLLYGHMKTFNELLLKQP